MATQPKLSGAALRALRALGHALSPVVAIGKDGMTESLVRAIDAALTTHELVKVKIQREAPVERHESAIDIAARTGSVLAQVVGRTLLLYRRHPKKPKIVLPAKGASGAKGKPSSGSAAERQTKKEKEGTASGRAVEKPAPAGDEPGDND